MKPSLRPQVVMVAAIILLLTLLLIQWFTPAPAPDIDKYEKEIDSLEQVNRSLLNQAAELEAERNVLRDQVLAKDSIIEQRNQSINQLKTRRNETSTRIDGLDNDGLIDFFSGFNTQADTTGR